VADLFGQQGIDAPDDALLVKWARIRQVRSYVLKEIEVLREAGNLGSSLQADVRIRAPRRQPHPIPVKATGLSQAFEWTGDDYEALQSLGNDLKFVLIVSDAQVSLDRDGGGSIKVGLSGGAKCERCWHWRNDVGHDPAHPGLCGRCTSNLYGAGEVRKVA
jgi:isoleucyl-tRNA synthetase